MYEAFLRCRNVIVCKSISFFNSAIGKQTYGSKNLESELNYEIEPTYIQLRYLFLLICSILLM